MSNTMQVAQAAVNGTGDMIFTRTDLAKINNELGFGPYNLTKLLKEADSVGRGKYDLSSIVTPKAAPDTHKAALATAVSSVGNDEVFVPAKDKTYIKWGAFNDVVTIIESKMFFPVYITGLSGNGKTMMVEQACANAKREYVRVQITPETDEDDLIGGFRLIDGETVFFKGPVIKAMESGAILLIDELDRGSNKIMCLQGVLEGKPVLLKKTGEMISPAKGFNVLATTNTKGRGSDDGRFSAATIVDEAFLERFPITIEQPFPTSRTEVRILDTYFKANYPAVDAGDFFSKLVDWADVIRKTFFDEGVDEVISTRRLVHIAQTYGIFQDRKKSIELCISRFDTDTKEAFVDLYSKVDAGEIEATDNTRENALMMED